MIDLFIPSGWLVAAFWLIYATAILVTTALAVRRFQVSLSVLAAVTCIAISTVPATVALLAMVPLCPPAERLFGVLGAVGSILCLAAWFVRHLILGRLLRLMAQEPAHDDTG